MQVLVLLVPVFFGFMGFAIDLGRLYLARGELKTAANSMALAAAGQLIGTEASTLNATTSGRFAIDNIGGYGNKYDFGGIVIGEGSGRLASAAPEPVYYENVSSATGEGGGAEADTAAARYVRVDITADAPLIFWSFLSLGQERKTPVTVRAVAGASAPLCSACSIEPIAIAPITADDTTHFGYSLNQRYTFGFFCNGAPQPSGLQNAVQRIPYLLLNRYNEEATVFPEETSQAYRIGAGGLPANPNPARSCVAINGAESLWVSATPVQCQNQVPQTIRAFTCGVSARFDSALPSGCEAISEAANIITAYTPDADLTDLDDWTAYTGNLRRVITVPVVDALSPAGGMTVLGFRQFVIQPDLGTFNISPNDINGRFIATYIGSPVPLKSGSFSGCSVASGPGKVVLHQ